MSKESPGGVSKMALLRRYPQLLLFVVVLVGLVVLVLWRPVIGPALSGAADARVGDERISLQHEGQARTYWLHPPKGAPQSPRPLLVVLHGRGQTGRGIARLTRFDELADRKGFVAVYPDGVDKAWNDGANITPADDVSFVRAVIDDVVQSTSIDTRRVYVAGLSSGGMLAYRFACEGGGTAAAVASVVGNLPTEVAKGCSAARPTSIIAIASPDDQQIYYNGEAGRHISAPDSAQHLAKLDQCQNESSAARGVDAMKAPVQLLANTGCAEDTEVVLISTPGGHAWPGGTPLDATGVIWRFLAAHPRPA